MMGVSQIIIFAADDEKKIICTFLIFNMFSWIWSILLRKDQNMHQNYVLPAQRWLLLTFHDIVRLFRSYVTLIFSQIISPQTQIGPNERFLDLKTTTNCVAQRFYATYQWF